MVHVAAGVVVRSDGAVLLADRPAGKPYAGYWEFPGGKFEPGESAEQALARELAEELKISVTESRPWIVFEHDYPHAYVRLYFRKVVRWNGEPTALEGQRVRFYLPRTAAPEPLLPAALPVVRWLRLPERLPWNGQGDAGGNDGEPRERLIGGERWLACAVRDRGDLERAAARGADFAVAPALADPELASLCRETPVPVYARTCGDDWSDAALARVQQLGAHGLAL